MLNLDVKTKLSKEKALQKLKNFFGKGGLGLEIVEETPDCIDFEGGGGRVTATLCPEEGNKIRINLVAQEWDYQVKKFVSTLP
jgi:hypothetical protein